MTFQIRVAKSILLKILSKLQWGAVTLYPAEIGTNLRFQGKSTSENLDSGKRAPFELHLCGESGNTVYWEARMSRERLHTKAKQSMENINIHAQSWGIMFAAVGMRVEGLCNISPLIGYWLYHIWLDLASEPPQAWQPKPFHCHSEHSQACLLLDESVDTFPTAPRGSQTEGRCSRAGVLRARAVRSRPALPRIRPSGRGNNCVYVRMADAEWSSDPGAEADGPQCGDAPS
jgi:hypothetical protein